MKRFICLITAIIILALSFAGCSAKSGADNTEISVVTTVFPLYDWTRQIIGERSDHIGLTMLLDSGVDLHSYQPSADDLIKISNCDIFIYVGGESDEWVSDALKTKKNGNLQVINLLDILGSEAKEEETVEGMQEEEEHGEEEETEYDEHVWLSLRNAEKFVLAIKNAIEKADADNAGIYSKNAAEYINKLDKLDGEYKSTVDAAKLKTMLFADRFPFRYLADDYGLSYYAAFSGCSAESEASFETVTFLANKVDELGLSAVLIIDGSDGKIAETVVSSSNARSAKILTLDSMQSVTEKKVADGADYLLIMQKNLDVLSKALDA